MYSGDPVSVENNKFHRREAPTFQEQAYHANCGHPTGMSTVGFRSGRYKPEEAADNIQSRKQQVAADIDKSTQLRGKLNEMITEADVLVKKNFQDTTLRLKERLTDINFWKTELEREIRELNRSTDILERRRNQLHSALQELDQAVHIATDNLNARHRRIGEDYQQDDVEMQLLKELDILSKAAALYKRAIEQCERQMQRNADVKQDLEMIWSDKKEADELMTTSVQVTPFSTNKQYFHGETRRHPLAMQSTQESWAQHAHDAIVRADHERLASDQLFQLTENIIGDVVKDITNQKDIVNMEFQKHLDKLQMEKAALSQQLKETNHEINTLENKIIHLRNAISEKEDYVKVVQTRLHLHNQRPCVENCRDAAQVSLLNESADLGIVLEKLNAELVLAENDLKHMQDNQVNLEKQIQNKVNSIQVDFDHCVRHRTVFPNTVKLSGHGG